MTTATDIQLLENKRKALQETIESNHAYLQTALGLPNAGMDACLLNSLVDIQGFPRADIDIIGIKSARGKLSEALNDLKSIREKLMEELNKVHGGRSGSGEKVVREEKGFLKVASVERNGPCKEFNEGDVIYQFGAMTQRLFKGIEAFQKYVWTVERTKVPVKLMRGAEGEKMELLIVPCEGDWVGRLGCQVVAM